MALVHVALRSSHRIRVQRPHGRYTAVHCECGVQRIVNNDEVEVWLRLHDPALPTLSFRSTGLAELTNLVERLTREVRVLETTSFAVRQHVEAAYRSLTTLTSA